MSESVIEWLPSQWQKRTTKTAEYSICGSSGGGVDGIGLDEIHHDRHKGEYKAKPDEHSTQDRNNPKNLFFGCPTIDKKADGNAGCAGQDWGEAVFGLEVGSTSGGKGHSVGDEAVNTNAAHHANAESKISEADQGGGEVVSVLEDVCEGCEKKIEVAVDESHVG